MRVAVDNGESPVLSVAMGEVAQSLCGKLRELFLASVIHISSRHIA